MARYLSQEQIAEFRECFSLYDKKRNGKIRSSDLAVTMRSLGSSPTQKELAEHLKKANKKPSDEMDFSEFLTVMHDQLTHEDPAREILEAFKLSDERGRGTIPASYLRTILTRTGEKLGSKEVDKIFHAADIRENGSVSYHDFVKLITAPLPDY